MYKYTAPTWPRPPVVPVASLTYLVLNLIATYGLDMIGGNIWWVLPSWGLNIFFFWAERIIYCREKRNFDGWNEEMRILLENPNAAPDAAWNSSLRSVHRRRRARKKSKSEASTA